MMSQHPGFSQPYSRQQQGFNDMQSWRQHFMYKQQQEIQRQQQLQHLDQGFGSQNLHTQPSRVARQEAQFPGVLNGMPISDASNYMWSSEHLESELKTLNSSRMLFAGTMNMAQHGGFPMRGISNGPMSSHDQGQLLRLLGFVPQLDQSLNETPVPHSRGSLICFSQIQGMSHDCADAMTRSGGNQAEKPSMQSSTLNCFQSDHFMVPEQHCLPDGVLVAEQGFQGKGSFAIAPVQGPNNGTISGNYQQSDYLRSLQAQEFQGRQEQNDWSGNLQERAMMQVKASHDGTSLDRTEEKLLFGNEDDGNWTASFGSSITSSTGFLHGNPVESNDHFGSFPSIQSGSWSALMQEAVEASSSDTGLHEEWSSLSFQKTELSGRYKSAVLSDNGKQQMMWDDHNLQGASPLTSGPFPLFNDADAGSNCHTSPSFEHPTKFAYELNERVSTDASHESIQQPSKEASKEHLNQSHQQKQFVGATFQALTQLDDVSNGAWEGEMYGQSPKFAQPTGMEMNLQNMQVLVHQQKMPNVNSQLSNKPNGWNANGSPAPDLLKVHDNDVTSQDAQRYETNKALHMKKKYDSCIWKAGGNQAAVSFPNFSGGFKPVRSDKGSPRMSSDDACMGDDAAMKNSRTLKFNQEINQLVLYKHQVDYGKHVAVDSSVKYKGDENFTKYQNQLGRVQHAWDSSLNSTDQGVSETHNHKEENNLPRDVNEGFVFSQTHPTQHIDPGVGARKDSLLAGNEHHYVMTNVQKSTGQSGWRTLRPHRFQCHVMGNSEMNIETDSQTQRSYFQGPSHLVVHGSKNQEQAGHVVGCNAVHIGKGHLIDIQESAKGAEEIQYKGSIPDHDPAMSSFNGVAAHFSQNRSAGQASQNILNLLHKVEQSREINTVARFSDSKQSVPSEIPVSAASDGSAHLQHSQSSAFGLKLAPPCQQQPLSSTSLPSQTSLPGLNDCDSKSLDSGAGDHHRITEILSIPHETPQRENLDNKSSMFGKVSKSGIYEKSLVPSSLHYAWDRDISGTNELATMDKSANPFGSESDVDGRSKQSSNPNVTDDSSGSALPDQSAQALLPSLDRRVSSFRLVPSADTCVPIASYPLDSGHSQLINGNSHVINSGQQLSLMETKSVDQHSAAEAFSQQGGFSTMLHNVRASVPSQQCPSGAQPQKTLTIVNQSVSPLPSMRVTKSCTLRTSVDDKKGESAPYEFGASSIDSQEFTYGRENPMRNNSSDQNPSDKVNVAAKKGSTPQGQEPVLKHLSDGNYSISILSPVRLHQQDLDRVKHGQDLNFASLNHDAGISGQALKSLDAHAQNYSLLQQMYAMKGAESDPSKRIGKRLKGEDLGSDALQMESTGQRFIFGQNPVLKELDESFQASVKMLNFSSKENEGKSTSACSEVTGRDLPYQDLLASRQYDIQSHANSHRKSSMSTSVGGNEQPQIAPQMAPSWFEQCGTYKNGQILEICDGLGNSQKTVIGGTCFFAKVSESMHNSAVAEQRTNVSQVGNHQQNTSSTTKAANEDSPSHCLPPGAIDKNKILMPKKRKSATSELLPWHKEVMQGSRRMQTISMAELDWAQTANRLIKKVEDEFEIMEDGTSIARLHRRLVLTTQLMQQLIPCVPARFLNADVTAAYGSLTYFGAKLALGDACSFISCSENDSHMLLDNSKMRPEELKTDEKAGDSFFFKVMENFIGRLGKLESSLLRLEKRSSILDLRVECQNLERCSIINRFAKFHGRAQPDGVESSSASENAPRRAFHQRHVTAFSMSGNFPEGVLCFSL